MRTGPNHWLSIVVLSAMLGWILVAQGPAAASGGPADARTERASLATASRSGAAARTPDDQAPSGAEDRPAGAVPGHPSGAGAPSPPR